METFIKSGLEVTPDKFREIADLIMNKSVLVVNSRHFRICEIEFYLRNNAHNDEYVHGNPDQSKYNLWYFHQKGASYKNGTFRGLDIAVNKVPSGYSGILIRAIWDIENSIMIEGPCLSVNKILELYECSSIPDFIKQKVGNLTINSKLSVTANHHNFTIQNCPTLKPEVIYCGRRVGLSDKYPEWKDKPYRFLIMKNKIKKQKMGLMEC